MGGTVFRRVLCAFVLGLLLAPPVESQSQSSRDSLVVLVVRSDSAQPLEALVELRAADSDRAVQTLADRTGRAAFARPTTGTAGLRVRMLGYTPASVDIALDTVHAPIRIALVRREMLPGEICTTESVPAIQLARDSLHQHDSTLATIRVRSGRFEESRSVRLIDWTWGISFAHERAGRYTVEVKAPGFRPWRRRGVVVVGGPCHVTTRSLTVRLSAL